jgi:hypothetical protein
LQRSLFFGRETLRHWGSYVNGNALFEYCEGGDNLRSTDSPIQWGQCWGYILGVADLADGKAFCLPDAVTAGQLIDIVKIWLRDNPHKRHYSADSLVAFALKEKVPLQLGGVSSTTLAHDARVICSMAGAPNPWSRRQLT